jgi:competence protein ComEC
MRIRDRIARSPPGTTAVRDEAIGSGYETFTIRGWHPPRDPAIAVSAAAVIAGVWLQPAITTVARVALLATGVLAAVSAVAGSDIGFAVTGRAGAGRRRALGRAALAGLVLAAAVAVGSWRGQRAWQDAEPRALGPYAGWTQVAGDQLRVGSALRVTLRIDGERFDAWVYGSARRRLAALEAGEWVEVSGERQPLGIHARRAQVRHVVGRFEVDYVADGAPGSRLDEASRKVRAALRRSAEASMAAEDAALFTGLVIGDDTRQPQELIEAFRAAGLSHLTAVSGQNLAFLLALAGPGLRRLRPWARWVVTLALIGWFVSLTRFEPSIMRAGAMAALAATALVRGGQVSPARLLYLAVAGLVLVDPLLVWRVGFWLSVGATWGVVALGPRLSALIGGPRWLAVPLGITVGAQLGVAVPSVLVFGRLPSIAVPANLLAVPAAGLVMLYGVPAAIVGDLVPPLRGVLMVPAVLATRWVKQVALGAAAVDVPPAVDLAVWSLFGLIFAVAFRRRSPPGWGMRG